MNWTFNHAESERAMVARWTSCFLLISVLHAMAVIGLLHHSPQSAVPMPVPAFEVSFIKFAPPVPTQPVEPIPEPKPKIAAVEVSNAEPIVVKHKKPKPERKRRRQSDHTPPRPETVDEPAKRSSPDTVVADLRAEQPRAPVKADFSAEASRLGPRPDYLAILAAWLERHKEYPRRARLRGQEGRATLEFVVDRTGRVLSYRIQNSSGYQMLDQAVEDMIQRAQPLPRMPDDLHETQIDVVVPVQFSLK